MNRVWTSTFVMVLVGAFVGLMLWPLAGSGAAWAAVAFVFALGLVYHARHLGAFLNWLRRPELRMLPQGSGVWEEALAELHGHLKRSEATTLGLERSLQRLRAAGQALPEGVVVLDAEHHIEWSNATAARHFGIDPARDPGQAVTNLVRDPDFVAYLEGGNHEQPLTFRSSRASAVLSVRVIHFGEHQKLLTSRDVTDEERVATMRRDFVANVSHEMKTPITVLAGFVETLSNEDLALPEKQRRRYLALMGEQAQRMRRLIEDLLTLSSLEASPSTSDEIAIDMPALMEKLADEARAISAGRHRITTSGDSSCLLIGNPQELTSAFSNLVSNAVRYTLEGGTVGLAWRIEEARGVFSVEDNGIGIEPRHLPRLTERFYRVDSSRSRETGGTGLGLAIVKHVLTRHDANLDVQSVPGRGSKFSAVFPASRLRLSDGSRAAA